MCICLSKKDILIQGNRCGTTGKVAMEQPPWSFGFMPLPFVALWSGVSFVLCIYGVILKTEWMLRLEAIKIDDEFEVGTIEG
jgi:hypothetical protein